jgi:UDP-glucose 4-epimerase
MIGEDPSGIPNNLMPYICQVAVGRHERLSIFGNDYPTVDGTGVRDYLHVLDLARAHADALEYLADTGRNLTVNLGTGRGVSVLELVRAFERASGREIPYDIVGRRPGDVAAMYADPSLAEAMLGWRAELDLEAMCRDAGTGRRRTRTVTAHSSAFAGFPGSVIVAGASPGVMPGFTWRRV